jgi:Ulp1 protease family, C-terminal catalytic domain
MSDKSSFVRYDYSIAFKEPFDRKSGIRYIPKLFASWRKKIDKFRTEAQNRPRQKWGLVHFCPLNPNGNHFTLLKINKREKNIYHYDSMASKDIIEDRVELNPMGKLIQIRSDKLDGTTTNVTTTRPKRRK